MSHEYTDKPKRGQFIAIEGNDGSGKTSVISKLKTLLGENCLVRFHAAPSKIGVSGKLRQMFLQDHPNMHQCTDLMLFMACLIEEYKQINEWLDEGHHVISDRWMLSTMVYQANALTRMGMMDHYVDGFTDMLEHADMYILLGLDHEARMERLNKGIAQGTHLDKFDMDASDTIAARSEAYEQWANAIVEGNNNCTRCIHIDTNEPISEVVSNVVGAISRCIKGDPIA